MNKKKLKNIPKTDLDYIKWCARKYLREVGLI